LIGLAVQERSQVDGKGVRVGLDAELIAEAIAAAIGELRTS